MSNPGKAVFLSYAREDIDAARRIAEAMRSQGIEVWFDENELRGGEAWDAKIRRQIDHCALFVPLISRHTDERGKGYFRLEWKLAVEQTSMLAEGIPFVAPVVIDDTREQGAKVPAEFLRVQWTRLPGALPTPQLIEQIRRLLAQADSPQNVAVPAGERNRTEARSRGAGRRTPWIGYGAAFLAGAAVMFFAGRGIRPTETTQATSKPAKDATRTTVPVTTEKSVAVLAFENLSGDAENEYFSDGISEELLNVLAKTPGLRVAARTSAFYFKKKQIPIAEVARQLGVGYVVEGSVRKVGSQVRITAQLINAADGFHVWSDTFTRELKDIFALQDEIAGVIAKNLQLKVGHPAKITKPVNPEAHRLVLEGRHFFAGRSEEGFRGAVASLERAIAVQPDLAEAHGVLGLIFGQRATSLYADGFDGAEPLRQARSFAQRAIELDSTSADAEVSFGYIAWLNGDFAAAIAHLEKAIRLNPNSSDAQRTLGLVYANIGRLDLSLAAHEKAAALDPLEYVNLYFLARTMSWIGRFEEALEFVGRTRNLQPAFIPAHGERAYALWMLGRADEAAVAARYLREHRDIRPRWGMDAVALGVLRKARNEKEASEYAAELLATLGPDDYQRGFILAQLGRFSDALPYLEKTPLNLMRALYWSDVFDPHRDDPRFQALIAKLRRTEEYKNARETIAQLRRASAAANRKDR